MATRKSLSAWTVLWLAWLLAFLGIELPSALDGKPGGTLSEHTWDWFSLRSRRPYWFARRVIFVVFWLSLGIGHFLLQAPVLWSVILPGIPFAAVIGLSSFVWKDATTGVEKEFAMPFKLTVPTVVAALLAGLSAFGAAYNLAAADQMVSGGEWLTVAWATVSAIGGALYQQKREVWTPERRAVEAQK